MQLRRSATYWVHNYTPSGVLRPPKRFLNLSLVGIWTDIPDVECPDFDCPDFVCTDFDCPCFDCPGFHCSGFDCHADFDCAIGLHASVSQITVSLASCWLRLRSLQLRSLQILTVQVLTVQVLTVQILLGHPKHLVYCHAPDCQELT